MVKSLVIILIVFISAPILASEDKAFMGQSRESFKQYALGYQCLGNLEQLYHIYTRKDDTTKLIEAYKTNYQNKQKETNQYFQTLFESNPVFKQSLQEYSLAATEFNETIMPLYKKADELYEKMNHASSQEESEKLEDQLFALDIGGLETDFYYDIHKKKYFKNIESELKKSTSQNSDGLNVDSAWIFTEYAPDEILVEMQIQFPDGTYHRVETKIKLPILEKLEVVSNIVYDTVPQSLGVGIINEQSGFNYDFNNQNSHGNNNSKLTYKFQVSSTFEYMPKQVFNALGLTEMTIQINDRPHLYRDDEILTVLDKLKLSIDNASSFEDFYRNNHSILDEYNANKYASCLAKIENNQSVNSSLSKGHTIEYKIDHRFPAIPSLQDENSSSLDSN